MKRLGLVLAACAAMSGAYAAPAWDTGYAYGANHCYGFHAPAGWTQDNRLLADKGVPMVFLPQDGSLRAARVMIYAGSIGRKPGENFSAAVRGQVNDVVAQYALSGYEQPIGVSDYQLSKAIPENLKAALPSIEEVEEELTKLIEK